MALIRHARSSRRIVRDAPTQLVCPSSDAALELLLAESVPTVAFRPLAVRRPTVGIVATSYTQFECTWCSRELVSKV
jgi:hypothetical protein